MLVLRDHQFAPSYRSALSASVCQIDCPTNAINQSENIEMGRLGLFTKEQLAARNSLAVTTIDHYAEFGLITPVHLHDGVFFTSKAFLILEIIEKGKRLGFTLGEIRELTAIYNIEH